MSLSIGIVGLPNVGKSTLFNALTKKGVPAENYPFCTIDPSVGIVAVPDMRLAALSDFSQSVKTIPAAIQFVDIAGLVEGASKGEGLGNKFLSHIREVDAILHLVRLFPVGEHGTGITHVYGTIDPLRDMQVITLELIMADVETVEKRMQTLGKEVKKQNPEALKEYALLERVLHTLQSGVPAYTIHADEVETNMLAQLCLLSRKPVLFGLNTRAGARNFNETHPEEFQTLLETISASGARYVLLDAKIEDELKEFEGEEKTVFRKEYGVTDDGINTLITESYTLLGLETYFTTGPEETRAWTILKGSSAPKAGAAIHSDFEHKFIRAEVIFWKDLLDAGSYGEARSRGKLKTEGKEYIVKDGDVIEFKV